ncbi:hypothetical protein L249_6207 [Ophiocordyceps polyrhachis-furcata BCC 54312]|uniref:Uncharacterized protein n=1 Tax=Ophiocordyceps polyrhachis-furcata BCC 54312 TaxID=1330021 RepID=A0A367L1R4_9HYPO|nr:hypothetical protein L249_6207 [Ophiocordyceps polyrhachis-furcata BCC 54312]
MTSRATASRTPSPSGSVRTPPAPRHGFTDDWEPYSPPRKSVRISSQLAATRKAAAAATPRTTSTRTHQPASPHISRRPNIAATMVSPVPSPRKKPAPAADAHRQPSGTLTAEAAAEAAATLGLADAKTASTASVSRASDMLPTPSKTPQKPPNKKTAAHIQTIARNLFGSDDKRRPKKYSGMTLDSFTAVDDDEKNVIEIFTDLQDRVPVKDHSADNPFFGDAAVAEPVKRRSKRRLVHVPGQGALSIEEASRRDDGMVYVFRGKKIFREFSQMDDSQPDTSAESEASRPLTRSSVKPRLLFPRRVSDKDEEEEATTDVEDTPVAGDLDGPHTPKQADDDLAKTPEAPKFAPVSPPDTKRTTRSANKLAHEGTPLKQRASGRRSPFDTWPRTKEVRHSSATKRHGESLTAPSTKRTRA